MAGRILPVALATISGIAIGMATFGEEFKEQQKRRLQEEYDRYASPNQKKADDCVLNLTVMSLPHPPSQLTGPRRWHPVQFQPHRQNSPQRKWRWLRILPESPLCWGFGRGLLKIKKDMQQRTKHQRRQAPTKITRSHSIACKAI